MDSKIDKTDAFTGMTKAKQIKEKARAMLREVRAPDEATPTSWTALKTLMEAIHKNAASFVTRGLNEERIRKMMGSVLKTKEGRDAMAKALAFGVTKSTNIEKMAIGPLKDEYVFILTHAKLTSKGGDFSLGKIIAVYPAVAIYVEPLQVVNGLPRLATSLSSGVFLNEDDPVFEMWKACVRRECIRQRAPKNDSASETEKQNARGRGEAYFKKVLKNCMAKQAAMLKEDVRDFAECKAIVNEVLYYHRGLIESVLKREFEVEKVEPKIIMKLPDFSAEEVKKSKVSAETDAEEGSTSSGKGKDELDIVVAKIASLGDKFPLLMASAADAKANGIGDIQDIEILKGDKGIQKLAKAFIAYNRDLISKQNVKLVKSWLPKQAKDLKDVTLKLSG